MNTKPYNSVVTRVADGQWHLLEDDLVVGRGHCMRRPDGRLFVSIDAWRSAAFERLAEAMLSSLPAPLYTVAGEGDLELTANWQRAGFTIRRREWEFVVPTDPRVTGLGAIRPPSGVRIVPIGEADEGQLRALDLAIREEVEAGAGWQSMPAEIRPRPEGVTIAGPSRSAVAAAPDRYLGLLRLGTAIRQPRIGLIGSWPPNIAAASHGRCYPSMPCSANGGTLGRVCTGRITQWSTVPTVTAPEDRHLRPDAPARRRGRTRGPAHTLRLKVAPMSLRVVPYLRTQGFMAAPVSACPAGR